MSADTEKTMRIRIARDQAGQHQVGNVGALASTIGYWTGMAGMLLAGALAVVAVQMTTPLTPTQVTFDLLRAATLGGLVVAAFCWFIHYEAAQVVQRLERQVREAADRNRNATEDVKHSMDGLRDETQALRRALPDGFARLCDKLAAQRDELDRIGTLADRRMQEIGDELQRLRARMAEGTADIVGAYEAGVLEGEKRQLH